MKEVLKNRYSSLASLMALARRLPDTQRRRKKPQVNYRGSGTHYNFKPSWQDVDTCDSIFNFYLRVILEHGYKRVAEIGVWDAIRIMHLKRLLPDVEFTGYDLNIEKRNYNGVILKKLPKCRIDTDLILSCGVFTYMNTDEFKNFLDKNRTDLAIVEPEPIFNFKNDLYYRRTTSYYHNYKKLLSERYKVYAGRPLFKATLIEYWVPRYCKLI